MWVGPLPQEGARVAASACALLALALFYLVHQKHLGRARACGRPRRTASPPRPLASTCSALDAMAFAHRRGAGGPRRRAAGAAVLVYPTNGVVTTVKGFEIIVIGGLGSIPGALVGGLAARRGRKPRRRLHLLALPERLRLPAGAAGPAGPPDRPVRRARSGRPDGSRLLVAEGVTKRYGGLVANDGVTMAIGAGEVRGLIGPNGAGKTTFVNLITGIEQPDAATSCLTGRRIVGLRPHQIAAHGLVRSFQVARVFGNLTVRENLMRAVFRQRGDRGRRRQASARADELLRARDPGAARRRARQIAVRWPAHAAAGLRGIHDSRRAGSTCSTSRSPASIRWSRTR